MLGGGGSTGNAWLIGVLAGLTASGVDPAAADRVIGDVREDGLAALIEELWFDGPKAEPSGRDLGSAWAQIESAGGQ